MAIFSVEIPDDKVDLVLDSVSAMYRYQEMVTNPEFDDQLPEDEVSNPAQIANPETKAMFVNRMVRQWLGENVKAHASKMAAQAAREAALAANNIEITDPQL